MIRFKSLLFTVAGMLMLTGASFAQGGMQQQQTLDPDSISEQELEQFAVVALDVQTIQRNVQQELRDIVEEEEMELPRFEQIIMSRQNPQTADQVEVTEEEEEKITKLQPKLQELNQRAQKVFIAAIEGEEMNPQRYQQIAQTVQTNQELIQKVQEMWDESAEEEQN